VTDAPEAIAETLEAGIAEARRRADLAERAPELELTVAAYQAGVPVEHPVAQMFLRQYRGPVTADHLVAAWHRQVLGTKPPAEVTERLAERESEARLEHYRQVLEQETQSA
jgi:hypothetical protein